MAVEMKKEVEATTHVTAERGPGKQQEATRDLLTGTHLLGYGLISGLQWHPGEEPPLDSGPPPLLGPPRARKVQLLSGSARRSHYRKHLQRAADRPALVEAICGFKRLNGVFETGDPLDVQVMPATLKLTLRER